jgi:hypothetical protein
MADTLTMDPPGIGISPLFPNVVLKRPLRGPFWFWARIRRGQTLDQFMVEDRAEGHEWRVWRDGRSMIVGRPKRSGPLAGKIGFQERQPRKSSKISFLVGAAR